MIEIDSLDDANEAVFEEQLVLRVQPKAPAPTEYYWVTDGWRFKKAGQRRASAVEVSQPRQAVKRALGRENRTNRDDLVRAVDPDHV